MQLGIFIVTNRQILNKLVTLIESHTGDRLETIIAWSFFVKGDDGSYLPKW